MPRGAPDYSNVSGSDTLSRLDDMAELAARMGSPMTHNREGYLVFMETFQYGCQNWATEISEPGGSIGMTVEKFRSDGYSVKFVAHPDDIGSSEITMRLPALSPSPTGLEVFFALGDYISKVEGAVYLYDGWHYHEFRFRYDDVNSVMSVKDSDGSFKPVVEDLDLTIGFSIFNSVKLVGNLITDDYVRIIINSKLYTINGHKAFIGDSNASPHVQITVRFESISGYAGYMYLDDVLLTQNEP